MTEEKKMNYDEVKATFPGNTVFLYTKNGHVTRAETGDFYARRGKTYTDCLNALEKSPNYKVVQDTVLYDVVKMLESANKKISAWYNAQSRLLEAIMMLNNAADELAD